MLRIICILIAFLVAAKGVVAFGNVTTHAEGKLYSDLNNTATDVWLCECEDSSEELSEADENDSESVILNFVPNLSLLRNSVFQGILHHSIEEFPNRLRQLFIGYRNLRL